MGDYRVLCAHSEAKGQADVAAFLSDADYNSRKYDIVIASPVISSGVSIEHRDSPHFTLGAYVGGGWATTPVDAMQQLGRVRYLQRFIIGLEQNNAASGGQVWSDEIKGRVGAAKLEQSSTALWTFDGLIANIKATHENARADFGAGLYWHLEAAGWAVHRKEIVAVDETVSLVSKALKEAHNAALIDAGHVDDATADLLRRVPERPKNVGIVAKEILNRLGLKAVETRVRIDGHQVRVIGTDMEHFARVLRIAERRAEKKAAGSFEWGEDDDPDL